MMVASLSVRKRSLNLLSLFFVFLLLNVLALSPVDVFAGEKNFLWEVRSGTTTVYVLGSIHFLKQEMYPLDGIIEDAFDNSDILVMEADISDIGNLDVQTLLGRVLYLGDETLEDHISADAYDTVKRKFAEFNMPEELIRKQKPWMLALTLTSLQLLRMGYEPGYGIDMHFLSKARGSKKIKELESLSFQINLLAGLSDSEQETFLIYTIDDLEKMERKVDGIVHAWNSGDTDGMASILSEGIESGSEMSLIYEKILYERNRRMSARIEDFLGTNETYFVVVGAGHLVGESGIIELLKEKGYAVKQL
jgi:uncharacterized protein YbaP (TraB family)